jgi:pilus assembly protein CpaE
VLSINVGLIIGSTDLLTEVTSALQDAPVRVVLEQREIGESGAWIEKLDRVQPDVILLALHQLPAPVEEIIHQIKATSALPRVIVVHSSADSDTILKCIRAGADEFVYTPLKDDLRAALDRIASERLKTRAGTAPRGKAFGFLSAKGGCGATTIACHLSLELHRQTNLSVLLADFDLDAGLVGFLMKSQSRFSVVDALENAHRMDLSLWKALVSNGHPGVEVIMAPTSPALHRPPNPENFRLLVPFARASYDWMVVDLGRSLSPVVMHVLQELDETFIVTTLEIPALHQTKHMIQTLLDSGVGQHRLHVLLNRTPKRTEVTLEELDRMLGVPIYATLPNDYPALYEAYSEGNLLPANSILGKNFARVAAKIAGIQQKDKKKRAFSFMS